MTARQGIKLGKPDIFKPQRVDATESRLTQTDESELSDSITHLFGGLSGLLFALSLSFFLQAPFVSIGVLLALGAGWTGRAISQARKDV